MSRKNQKKSKIDVSGGADLGNFAFEGLDVSVSPGKAPSRPEPSPNAVSSGAKKKKKGGRLDVKREKSGRGGKTVTVVYSFPGMDDRMKKDILGLLKKRLATGGTINSGNVEVQGDFAEKVVELLASEGYQAVRAGG